MELTILAYIKDGKYRLKTLELLSKRSMISSEIATELKISRASMSRILKSLKEKNLVNPTQSESRTILYSITDLGKEVLSMINVGDGK